MEFTFHGHGTFEVVSAGGTNVLIDPWTVGMPGGPGNPMNDLTPEDLDPDIVPITHTDAFDHAGEAYRYTDRAPVLCQGKMSRRLVRMGYDNVEHMDLGGEFEFGDVTFLMTQAFHSLGTGQPEFERVEYGGVAAGYVIDDGETRYYHSGDTCLFGDMKTVIGDVYEPDIAALPIGGRFTMEHQHAAVATEWLGVDAVIPYHYNTVHYIETDPQDFVDAVAGRCDAEVLVLESGESVEFTP